METTNFTQYQKEESLKKEKEDSENLKDKEKNEESSNNTKKHWKDYQEFLVNLA